MNSFCTRFRQLKEESGLTLKELSLKLDITIPNLSYYMKEREPSFDILVRIADEFNVSTDWLLGRSENRSTVIADPKSIIESKLDFSNDEKLSGEALERYEELQKTSLDVLESVYMLNANPYQNYIKSVHGAISSILSLLDVALNQYNQVFTSEITGNSAATLVKKEYLYSDIIAHLLKKVSLNYVVEFMHDEQVNDKEKEALQMILRLYYDQDENVAFNNKLTSVLKELESEGKI